nr:hypothetical protein [uncultured Dysosmobacter sp.]
MTAPAFCKLAIFLPTSHFPSPQQVLQSVDTGRIGRYDSCLL